MKPEALIATLLAKRDNPQHAGYRNAVRAAISPASEHFAYAYTERYLPNWMDADAKTGARRAAAICASAGATQYDAKYRGLGHSLRDLTKSATGSYPGDSNASHAIVAQISSLPMLDVENAATVIGLLVKRCAGAGITVNHYSLMRTLSTWGDGITDQSLATRSKLIADFYDAPFETTLEAS